MKLQGTAGEAELFGKQFGKAEAQRLRKIDCTWISKRLLCSSEEVRFYFVENQEFKAEFVFQKINLATSSVKAELAEKEMEQGKQLCSNVNSKNQK